MIFKQGLPYFFASLGPKGTPFDTKVVYDQYQDRFVVASLMYVTPGGQGSVPLDRRRRRQLKTGANAKGTGNSSILLAVSKTGSPATTSDFYFQAISSLEVSSTDSFWADYPGKS